MRWSREDLGGLRPDGVLVIDKPEGPTSHDVVKSVRRLLRTRVGHTGTLDPLATGVLPLVLGKATRLTRFFQGQDKEYIATVGLGKVTETYDREGSVVCKSPVPTISSNEVLKILDRFVGNLRQLPPMYSAVRVQGRRLYEFARSGQKTDRPLRQVIVYRINLLEQAKEEWLLKISCSSGTYVRSLAYDLGQAIGCGAFLKSLRRTRSGTFSLLQAVSPEQMLEDWSGAYVSMENLLPSFPRVELDGSRALNLRHGRQVEIGSEFKEGWCRVFYQDRLVALGETYSGVIQPSIVLDPV